MPHRDDHTQAEADDPTSTTMETDAPNVEDEPAFEGNASDGGERETRRPPRPGEGKFGMRVVADEVREHDPDKGVLFPLDVVAVHGLHGDRDSTWTTDETDDTPGSNWLKDRMPKWYSGPRIMSFGYDASSTSILTMAGIKEEAVRLLDDLVELRKGSSSDVPRPIVFLGHDIGGTIVKEALRIATFECLKYRSVKDWTRLLIFFACPHRCTSTRDMEDQVANLLFAKEKPRPVGAVRMIRELGRSIIETNGSFAASCIPTLPSIINVYSEEETAARQIFGKYTATMGIALERRVGCARAHGVMSKSAPDGLEEHIRRALLLHRSDLWSYSTSAEVVRCINQLSAPIHPLESSYGIEHRFDWIRRHKAYSEWLDGYRPGILHVHGATGAFDASEYIFQDLDAYRAARQKDDILAYFTFDRHDDRCNSAMAMLHTLLAQIYHHDQTFSLFVTNLSEQMSFYRSWTQADLFRLFRIWLASWKDGDILCVINGLEMGNDSQAAFLRDLCGFIGSTEYRCKIAITSTTNSDLQAALAGSPTINLDEPPEDPDTTNTKLTSEIALDVQELTQQRPAWVDFQESITKKLFGCGQDKHWRRLVLTRLRLSKTFSTGSATQRQLDLLPTTTLKCMLEQILAEVPPERQAWARKALGWILYASRPLNVWELGVALALEVDNLSDENMNLDGLVYRHVMVDLDEVFGGMFIIKHNEVHFAHPDARDFLMSADGEQEHVWYDVAETAHQEISDACHCYLSLRQVQDRIATSYNSSPTNPQDHPTLIPRYSLHEYAVKYWPRHYRLIPQARRPTERALEFVRNTNAMRCWAEAFWWLSNPISRTDRAFLSPLPIFAGLGLQDLVTEWLDFDAEAPEASQERALALAEAARNAHADVVHQLLAHGGYSQASLQDVLGAAISCCDEAVLDALVAYVADRIEGFEWPPAILCRAAQFGLEDVVRRLFESGASADTAITFQGMTPLHLAAREGHAGVVKILLQHTPSLTALSVDRHGPLLAAAGYGEAAIVKLLLDAGAELNAVDGVRALEGACWNGYHETVDILIEAGCDMGCNKRGDWSPLIISTAQGFLKITRLLLEKKASTEVKGPNQGTPLRFAAYNGHVELCKLLLENGADPNALSRGYPILAGCVARKGPVEIVKLLVENGAAVDGTTSGGYTALHWASIKGHLSIATYLLDRGADINRTTPEDTTSIIFAASGRSARLVQVLLGRGANLHLADKDGWTPIHAAFEDAETTRILMEKGADANRVTDRETPLHLAVICNQAEVVKVLLASSPDLETHFSRDKLGARGSTLLIVAVGRGCTEVVRLLLEAGANVNQKNSENSSFPLQVAVTRNNEDILRILLEYGPDLGLVNNDGNTALHFINISTPSTVAKLLINAGANRETLNKEKHTPLCMAVLARNVDVVNYLIEKKAELNIVGGKFGGPLHIACRVCNLELVKILVDAGAEVNLVDSSAPGTPIQSACRYFPFAHTEEKRESIIRYLIHEANADVTTVGGLERYALNSASAWSTPEMVKLILEKGGKTNVQDEMGRMAAHMAAVQSLGHLEPILAAGADVEARDAMGRTVLHWAAVGGQIDVVEHVLSRFRSSLDQPDIDGWTPLLWAVRGCHTVRRPASSNAQYMTITFLLDQGASPCVSGEGLDQEWSPVRVARYHGVDDAVVQLLMAKAKEKLADEGREKKWDEALHKTSKAWKHDAFCDSCLCDVYGICYKCEVCLDFDFCFKCYRSRQLTHPYHSFESVGPEYPLEDESERHEVSSQDDESAAGQERDSDESTTDESDSDESDKGRGTIDPKATDKKDMNKDTDESDSD